MPTTVVAVAESDSESPSVSARRRLRQTLNDALSLAAKAVKLDGEGDFTSSMEAYEQSIILLDKSITLMREHGSLAARSLSGRDPEQEVAQLQRIRDKYSARIQAHRQEMGQFVQFASTLPAHSPLSDYVSTLARPKIPRTSQTLPAPPPTAPLPPLPVPPKEGLDYSLQLVPNSAPYYLTTNPDGRPALSQIGLPSPESPYTAHIQDSIPQRSKKVLRTHASTPHLRMPLNSPPPPALLPSRPSLAAMGITLPPPPSHPPSSPPNNLKINTQPIARSLNSAPLVPISNVGYNAPLKRTKSTKAYPSSPSSPRPTNSPPAVRTSSVNRTEDAPPTPHANQPIPVGTQRPSRQPTWSSTQSFDSIATSDESSAPLTMKQPKQPPSPPAKATAFKKSPSTSTLTFSGSLHAQMAALPVMLLPKSKTSSLRPKTAPGGAMPWRNRSTSTNNLTAVKAANGSEGTLFIPSKPVPLSPMSPPFTRGLVSPNLLSPPLTSSAMSFSTPSLFRSSQAPTAVPQLPSKIPNFIATYSTVPSQKITAPKPLTSPMDATRQSFRAFRLVQTSLGTPVPAALSPSNPSQAQTYKPQGGGYVTDSLYVPCSVWHTPETWIFISNLGDKIKALEILQESLRAIQDAAVALFGAAARPQAPNARVVERTGSASRLQVVPSDGVRSRIAQEWVSALDGLLVTLGQLELGMGKKLGLGESVSVGGTMSRTKRVKDWSTRVARKSFGVASGKSSGALGAEYVDALRAVCAGVRMLDGHACAVARLTPHHHHQVAGQKPIRDGEDASRVEALAAEYQNLSSRQAVATRLALERIAGALASVVLPFVLRDLGVLMESSLDSGGDADWMGAML